MSSWPNLVVTQVTPMLSGPIRFQNQVKVGLGLLLKEKDIRNGVIKLILKY